MQTMTMIIYALLIILIVVAIMIGIRVIITLRKVDDLLDDVTEKVHSFDRLFEVIDSFNNKMASVGDSVVGFISGGLQRIFKEKKRRRKKSVEEED